MSSADERHGAVVYADDARRVRLRTESDGTMVVTVNPVRDGQEHYPFAYIEGVNYLRHPKPLKT